MVPLKKLMRRVVGTMVCFTKALLFPTPYLQRLRKHRGTQHLTKLPSALSSRT